MSGTGTVLCICLRLPFAMSVTDLAYVAGSKALAGPRTQYRRGISRRYLAKKHILSPNKSTVSLYNPVSISLQPLCYLPTTPLCVVRYFPMPYLPVHILWTARY